MHTLTLSNNLQINMKYLGARSQAKILDICCGALKNQSILDAIKTIKRDSASNNATAEDVFSLNSINALGSVIQTLAADEFDTIIELVEVCTNLEASNFDEGRADSLGLDDIVLIISKAIEVNDFRGIVERLGNVLMPLVGDLTSGIEETAQPTNSK